MDEPTSALDPEARQGLERTACRLAGRRPAPAWVTHDLAQADRLHDEHAGHGRRPRRRQEERRFIAGARPRTTTATAARATGRDGAAIGEARAARREELVATPPPAGPAGPWRSSWSPWPGPVAVAGAAARARRGGHRLPPATAGRRLRARALIDEDTPVAWAWAGEAACWHVARSWRGGGPSRCRVSPGHRHRHDLVDRAQLVGRFSLGIYPRWARPGAYRRHDDRQLDREHVVASSRILAELADRGRRSRSAGARPAVVGGPLSMPALAPPTSRRSRTQGGGWLCRVP